MLSSSLGSPFNQASGQKVQWSSLIDTSHGWLETNFSSLSVPPALSLSMFHYIHCCGSERLDSDCTSLLWGWSYSNHFGLCLTDQDNGGQRVFPDGLGRPDCVHSNKGFSHRILRTDTRAHGQRVLDTDPTAEWEECGRKAFSKIKWRKKIYLVKFNFV